METIYGPEDRYRCLGCHFPFRYCGCEYLSPLLSKTPVTILMHHRESFLASNTSFWASKILKNGKIVVRGKKGLTTENQWPTQLLNHQKLFLFPSQDAVELNQRFLSSLQNRHFHLIVPDGTWSQARKIRSREKVLDGAINVKLPFTMESQYYIRKQKSPENLCTFEAISVALGILEGKKVQERLLNRFQNLVGKLLEQRHYYCPWPRGTQRVKTNQDFANLTR